MGFNEGGFNGDGYGGFKRRRRRPNTGPKIITGTEIDTYTSLLMHMDGTEGGTTFTDECGKAVTVGGNVCTKTSIKKMGTACAYFDGNGDYLRLPTLTFGTSDFTIEAWICMFAMPTSDAWPTNWSSHMVIAGVGTTNATDGCELLLGATKLIVQSNESQIINGTHGITTGGWHHVAVTRRGSTFRLFVDGQIIATSTSTATMGTGAYTYIGSEAQQGAYFNGHMDEVRISIGTARWTENFTPSTDPYSLSYNIRKFETPTKVYADNVADLIRKITKDMEYKFYDDTTWTPYNPESLPDLSGYKTVQVRYKASEEKGVAASDSVTLYFTPDDTRDLVSASIVVDTDFIEVFYTTKSASEIVSAAITNLTVSLTSA